MLDFTELPPSGTKFEQLMREIFFKLGHRPLWSGVGPDAGRDLVVEELRPSVLVPDVRKWLVQCKHFAHGGGSVGVADLDSIVDSCTQHGATGYLLACSTHPSATVVSRLEAIGKGGQITTCCWDAVAIERVLSSPDLWPVAQRFFPDSAIEWRVYATEHPNRWVANFRGYYFHLANRIGSTQVGHFSEIESQLIRMEAMGLPPEHRLRLRAVYFDDKHGAYTWFIDYMRPRGTQAGLTDDQIHAALDDGVTRNGYFQSVDLLEREYNPVSDHFDIDHYDYYRSYLANYAWGGRRSR